MMPTKTRPNALIQARNCYSESQAREIGRTLCQARLALGMELAAVAESTFTRSSDLEALERGDFGAIASRIHLPVFLRVYGNHLRLSDEELDRLLDRSADDLAPPPEPKPCEQAGEARRRLAVTRVATLLAAIAGISGRVASVLHDGLRQRARMPGAEAAAEVADHNSELAQEIGRRLREARLARGEDLAQAARDQLVPARYLAALEQGALEQIPGRPYAVALVRAYGNHLGLDGAELVEPLQVAMACLSLLERAPRGHISGLRYRAAVTLAAFLLLTLAAGIGYYAFHRLRPGMTEAALSTVDPKARNEAKRTDDAPPAAVSPATIPGPVSAAVAPKAVLGESQPLASGIAKAESAAAANRSAAVQPTGEAVLVPPAETGSNGTGTSPDDPYAPGGLNEPRPEAAGIPGDGSSTSEGDRVDIADPVAPVPVDPGPIDFSPDTTTDVVEEPLALSNPPPPSEPELPVTAPEPTAVPPTGTAEAPPAEGFKAPLSLSTPAQLSAPELPATMPEPTAAPPTRMAGAPPAGRHAVRPSARVSPRPVTPGVGPRQGPAPTSLPVAVEPQLLTQQAETRPRFP
jgi:transcriptional regulator with XRE-family HTH domain